MKKSSIFILVVTFIIALTLSSCKNKEEEVLLVRDDWEQGVKENLNSLLKKYKNQNEYAVFDFDNTTCIFDIEEQLIVYQLETMSFEFEPDELQDMLLTDLDPDGRIVGYGYFENDTKEMTYSDLVEDIYNAYDYLYDEYGPFTYEGLSSSNQALIQATDEHKEFKTKMRMMYDLVCDKESTEVAYPWITYWFSNMTEQQVYDFSYRSHDTNSKVETEVVTWTTTGVNSITGATSVTWTRGIRVSDNLKELYNALTKNGIDVWVCSASSVDVVRAAVDCFGLHDICKGVLGMTNKLENGKYISGYDYETGVGYYTKPNGKWEKMTSPIKTQTQAKGKVVAIQNTLFKEYGNKGPIAGFGDSTGDFNFCTEFDSLKIALYFNRANRKPTDGGGLIAPLAMYQKNVLNYNLDKAIENGDTLYLLQGRDEKGLRSLRNSNSTLLINGSEKLYRDNNNLALYDFFKENNLTTKQIIDTYSIYTEDSQLEFSYGFFTTFDGYHNIKNK